MATRQVQRDRREEDRREEHRDRLRGNTFRDRFRGRSAYDDVVYYRRVRERERRLRERARDQHIR